MIGIPRSMHQGIRSHSILLRVKLYKTWSVVTFAPRTGYIRDVEIADAPVPDLVRIDQRFEGFDGFVQRDAPQPMKQVKIDTVCAQSSQAAFARGYRASAVSMI